ncbi:MAG: hypothetical protein PHF25_06930, partial [Candidatus Margulisbacteria bacterium]|nr:hypothetical protein [Candidatus Margulisiibacteriota bacterium]
YFQAVYNSDRGPAVNYRIAVTTQNEFGIKDFVFWGENTANMVLDTELSMKIYYPLSNTKFTNDNWFPLEWKVSYNWGISFRDGGGSWSPTANSSFRVFDATAPIIHVEGASSELLLWHNTTKNWMGLLTINITHSGTAKLDQGYYVYEGVTTQIPSLNGEGNVIRQLSVSFSVLSEGVNPVTVVVSDNAGNVTYKVISINKDTQPATINVSANLSSHDYFQNWITRDTPFYETISISFYDMGSSDLKAISVSLVNENRNYQRWLNQNINSHSYVSPWGFDWLEIPEGRNELWISIIDNATNTRSIMPLQIRKDLTPPYISKYLPTASYENRWFSSNSGHQTDGVYNRINLQEIDIDFVDTQSYVENIQYFVSNNNTIIASGSILSQPPVSSYNINWSIQFTSFNDGYNEVYVSFNDQAGFSVYEKVFYLQKDTVQPQLSIDASASNTEYFGKWYRSTPSFLATINFVASDNLFSRLNSVGYYVKNAAGTVVLATRYLSQNMNTSSYSFSLSNIPSADYMMHGTNNFWIVLKDNAGNPYEQKIFSFQRDIQAPVLDGKENMKGSTYGSWMNYYPDWVTKNNPLGFSDAESGIKKMEYFVSNNAIKSWFNIANLNGSANYAANLWIVSSSVLTEGVNAIVVSRDDVLGNSAFDEFVVKLDFTSPNYHSLESSKDPKFDYWYNENRDRSFLDNIIVTFSDSGHSLLYTIAYNVNGGEWRYLPGVSQGNSSNYTQQWGINWLHLNQGTNDIKVKVVDTARNEKVSPVLFSIKKDITSPNVISSEDVNDPKFDRWYPLDPNQKPAWLTELRITFNDEGYSNLRAVTLNIFNQTTRINKNYPLVVSGKTYYLGSSFSWGWIDEGVCDVYATMEDNAGNIQDTSKLFTAKKDVTRPSFVTGSNVNVFNGWHQKFSPTIPTIEVSGVTFTDSGGSSLNYIGYIVKVLTGGMLQYDISKNMNTGYYDNSWVLTTNFFQDGTNNIYVVISDNAGNMNSIIYDADLLFTIKLDSKKPSFDRKFEYSPSWTNTTPDFFNNVTLNFYDEGYSLIKDVYYFVSNNSWFKLVTIDANVNKPTRNTNWNIQWSMLTNGINEIYVSLNDNAGWSTVSKAFTVRKDVIPPSYNNAMTLPVATYNTWYNKPQPWMSSISVSFTDAGGSGIYGVYYKVDNASGSFVETISTNFVVGAVDSYSINWAVSWGVLVNGVNSISVLVSDNAGTLTTSNCLFWIKKDITSPDILHSITSQDFQYSWRWYNHEPDGRPFLYEGIYYNEFRLSNIPVSFRDSGSSNIKEMSYIIDNAGEVISSVKFENKSYLAFQNWGMDWTLFKEGINNVRVSVTDNAGNNSRSDVLFSIKKDVSLPSYNIISFNFTPTESYTSTTLNWMRVNSSNNDFIFYDQNLSKIKRVYYKFKLGNLEAIKNVYFSATRNEHATYDRTIASFDFSFSSAFEGSNEIYLGVEDFAENKTEYNVLIASFNKDTKVPTIDKSGLSWGNTSSWFSVTPSWWETMSGISFKDTGVYTEYSGLKKIEYAIYHNDKFFLTTNIKDDFPPRTQVYNGGWTIPWSKITSDLNIISVSVTDYAGNSIKEELFRINKDVLTTNIVVVVPSLSSQDLWYKEIEPWMQNINIDFHDRGMSLIDRIDYVVSINGRLTRNVVSEYTIPSNNFIQNWSISFGVLAEGANDILVYVSDNAANLVTTNVLFYIKKDTQAPSYNVTDNSFNTSAFSRWYNTTNIYDRLPLKVFDLGFSGLENIGLLLFNGVTSSIVISSSMGNYSGNFSSITTDWSRFAPGATEVRLKATDNAGNVLFSDVLFTIRKDQAVPSWSYAGAHDEESLLWHGKAPNWLNNIQVSFNDSGGSNISTVSYAIVTTNTTWFVIDGAVNRNTFVGWGISWNALSEGLNGIRVKVEDGARNVTMSPVLFTIKKDSTFPAIDNSKTVPALAQSKWYNTTQDWMLGITFSAREITTNAVNGAVSSLNGLGYIAMGKEFILLQEQSRLTLNSDFELSFSGINNGVNKVFLLASDNARNITSINVLTINKDIVNPLIIDNRNIKISSFNVWYNRTPNFCISVNVDFSDLQYSLLSRSAYVVYNNDGTNTYNIFTSTAGITEYKDDWNIYWINLTNNINTIDVFVEDHATNRVASPAMFVVRKDIIAPTYNISVVSTEKQKKWYKKYNDYDPAYQLSTDYALMVTFNDTGFSRLKSMDYIVEQFTGSKVERNLAMYQNHDEANNSLSPKFSLDWVLLSEGINTVSVRVEDWAGNFTQNENFIVRKDETAPQCTYNLTADVGTVWHTILPTWAKQISVNFSDTGYSLLSSVNYKVKRQGDNIEKFVLITENINGMGPFSSSSFTISWDALYQGTNLISFYLVDGARNTSETATFILRKDDLDPAYTINEPFVPTAEQETWYNVTPSWTEQKMNISFTDPGDYPSKLQKVWYDVSTANGFSRTILVSPDSYESSQPNYAIGWSIYWSDLVNGTNLIKVGALDWAGNNVSSLATVLTINKDTIIPVISNNYFKSIENEALWYNSVPFYAKTINVGAEDFAFSQLLNIRYYVTSQNHYSEERFKTITENLGGVASYSIPWNVSVDALVLGTNNVYLRAADRAGNIATTDKLFTIKFDNISPSIDDSLIDASVSTVYLGANNWSKFLNSITVNFSDADSLLSGIWYKLVHNTGVVTTDVITTNFNQENYTQPFSVSWSLVGGGTNDLFVCVTDNAGNYSEKKIFTLNRDGTPPGIVVTINTIDSQELWYRTAQPWLSGIRVTVSDDESGIGMYGYEVVTAGRTITITVTTYTGSVEHVSHDIFNISWSDISNEVPSTINVWAKDRAETLATKFLFVFKKDISEPRVSVNEKATAEKFNLWLKDTSKYSFDAPNSLNIVVYDPASKLVSLNYGLQVGKSGVIDWNPVFIAEEGVLTYDQGVAIPWEKTGQGQNNVWISAIDKAGNTQNYQTALTINKDTIAPSVHADAHLYNLGSKWIRTPEQLPNPYINIIFSDSSSGSGLKNVRYLLLYDGVTQNEEVITKVFSSDFPTASVFSTYNTSWTIGWDSVINGVNSLVLVPEDYAGNRVTQSIVYVNRDSIAPTANTANYFPDQTKWYNFSPSFLENVTVSFHDSGGSKLKTIWHIISNDLLREFQISTNINSNNYLSPWKINFSSQIRNGINYISLKALDNAYNTTNYENQYTFRKDVVKPTYNNHEQGESKFDYWYKDPQPWMSTINIDFFDTYSGLSTISYLVSNAEGVTSCVITVSLVDQVFEITKDWKISWDKVLTNGLNEVFVSFSDYAGNTQNSLSPVFTIKKDIIPPIISHNYTLNAFPNWYYSTPNGTTAINIRFYDTGSSNISQISYNVTHRDSSVSSSVIVSATSQESALASHTIPWTLYWKDLQEGINTVQVAVVDYAGNYVTQDVFVIKKDTETPTMNATTTVSVASQNVWYPAIPEWAVGINIDFGDNREGDSGIRQISYLVTTNINNMVHSSQNNFYVNTGTATKDYVENWDIKWSDLFEGTNNITLIVIDSANNTLTLNNYFMIKKDDSNPLWEPTSNFSEAIFQKWFNASNPPLESLNNVSINFYDVFSGLKSAQLIISNNEANTKNERMLSSNIYGANWYTQSWGITWDTLSNGINQVYIELVDSVNHSISYNVFNVQKDIETPTLTENINKNFFSGWLTSASPALINGIAVTLNDTGGSGLHYAEWKISANGMFLDIQPAPESLNGYNTKNVGLNLFPANSWKMITDAVNEIFISFNDKAGNSTMHFVLTLKKDTVAPSFSIVSTGFQGISWHREEPVDFGVTIHIKDVGASGINKIIYDLCQPRSYANESFVEGSVGFQTASSDFLFRIPISWNLL